MSISQSKELLEQSQKDIGGIPSKAAHEGWQKLDARRAVELVEELVSIIMPLEVGDLKGIVSDADIKSRKSQQDVNSSLRDESDFSARALKNTAEQIQTNAHMQSYALGRVEDSLPDIKRLVNHLQSRLGTYDANQRAGEEHAQGFMVGQDVFNTQIADRLSGL